MCCFFYLLLMYAEGDRAVNDITFFALAIAKRAIPAASITKKNHLYISSNAASFYYIVFSLFSN